MSKINASEKARIEVIKNATGKSYAASKGIWNSIKDKVPVNTNIDLNNSDNYVCKVYYHDLENKRTYFNLKPLSILRDSPSPANKYISSDAIFSPFVSNIIAAQKISVKFYSSNKSEYTYVNEVIDILDPENFQNDLMKEIETRKLLLNDFDEKNLKPIIYHYDLSGDEFDYVTTIMHCVENIHEFALCKIFMQLRKNKGGMKSNKLAKFIRMNASNPEYVAFFSETASFPQEDSCCIYNFDKDGNLIKNNINSTDFMFKEKVGNYPISRDSNTVNLLEAVNGANVQWKFNNYNSYALRVITDMYNNLNDNAIFKSVLIHCNHHNIPIHIIKSEEDLIEYSRDIEQYKNINDGELLSQRKEKVKSFPKRVIAINFNRVDFDEDNDYYRNIIRFANLSNIMIFAFNSFMNHKNNYNYHLTIFDDSPENLNDNLSFVREYDNTLISWNNLDYQVNGNIKYVMGNVDRTLARAYNHKDNLVSNILKLINNRISEYKLSDEYHVINLGVKEDYMPLQWMPFMGKNVKYHRNLVLVPHMQITDPMVRANGIESNKIYQVLLNHFNHYLDNWIIRNISIHTDVIDIYAELLKRYALMEYNDVNNIVDLPDEEAINPMVVFVSTDKLRDSSFDFNNISYIELFRLGRAAGMIMIEIGSNIYGSGEKNANIGGRLGMNMTKSMGVEAVRRLMSIKIDDFTNTGEALDTNVYAFYGDKGIFENYENIPPVISEAS